MQRPSKPTKSGHANPFWHLAALFFIAVPLNFGWEIAQGFLYMGMSGIAESWWHCFVASLGDGVLVLLMHLMGWIVFGRSDWFTSPGVKPYGLMLGSGLLIGVMVEWGAVDILHRWQYTEQMPLIPGSGIGLIPVLQMIVLPPLIFAFVSRWGSPGSTKNNM